MKDICMKKIKLTLAVLIAFLMTGCYPSGEKLLSTEDNEAISEQIEDIVSGNENLDVDVTLAESIMEVPIIDVTIRTWDKEGIKNLLLDGKSISEKFDTPSDDFPDEFINVYLTEDNWWLSIESGRFNFFDQEFVYAGFISWFDQAVEENLPDSLEGFPKEDAIKEATDMLDKLDIKYIGEPDIYAVPFEKINEELSEPGLNTDPLTQTKDDEFYVLYFPLQYEGIPISTQSEKIMGTGKSSKGTYIQAIVSRHGLVLLKCNGIFDEKYEKGESVSINVSAENALNTLIKSYSHGVITKPTTIADCRLVYFPTDMKEHTYTCSPFWEFTVYSYVESLDQTLKDYEYIDAQTGMIYSNYS